MLTNGAARPCSRRNSFWAASGRGPANPDSDTIIAITHQLSAFERDALSVRHALQP
jgi:hypothetical protein